MLRYRAIGLLGVLLVLATASAYLLPVLQAGLESYYVTEERIESLSSLILGAGTALIGAAAIVTSLVLFAMQVNIERMPHGLFRRLSSDLKLLGAFASAFCLAIGVATLSTLVDRGWVADVVLAACWAVTLILVSFLYAYRRALALINPLRQLGMLVEETRRELRRWARRAQRVAPLLKGEEGGVDASPPGSDSTHDVNRAVFFRINGGWDDGAKRAIRHAVSFARRYAEQGDYEVSGAGLNAVVRINAVYIGCKGKTIYANHPFVDNPLASDSVINETLEHLRQHAQNGIARQDEQQIEQALRAMCALVQVYLGIDYSSPYAEKSHAQLAATYLASAAQAVVPHDMADVLLEGQRLLGQSAQSFIARGQVNDIAVISEKIALIAATGCAKEDYRPVTMAGVTQLANLTFDLLRCKSEDIRFPIKEVRDDVRAVVKLFLKVADAPLVNNHSTFLSPYYSSTSLQSLMPRLAAMVNALSEAQADSEDARSVIRNIELWADGLSQTEKELLLAAIDARSQFTFEMIHWITGVTEILLAVSNAPACDERVGKELRKHARWLIATLTWIPETKEAVTFVETFQMTEELFVAALDARVRGCREVEKEIAGYLLSWAFKGGRYINGWGVLERGLCASAVIALTGHDGDVETLKTGIASGVQSDGAPEQDVLDHAARNIRERVERLHARGHRSSSIERGIFETDHRILGPLLVEIAEMLDGNVGGGRMDGGH